MRRRYEKVAAVQFDTDANGQLMTTVFFSEADENGSHAVTVFQKPLYEVIFAEDRSDITIALQAPSDGADRG